MEGPVRDSAARRCGILLPAAIGIGAAVAASRALSSLLYAVTASDPVTFVAISILVAVVALAAAYLPARRAARVDPVDALRSD